MKQTVYEKEAPKANGPPIISNLAEAIKRFWLTESEIDQTIKELKFDYVILSHCEELHVPFLNE